MHNIQVGTRRHHPQNPKLTTSLNWASCANQMAVNAFQYYETHWTKHNMFDDEEDK